LYRHFKSPSCSYPWLQLRSHDDHALYSKFTGYKHRRNTQRTSY